MAHINNTKPANDPVQLLSCVKDFVTFVRASFPVICSYMGEAGVEEITTTLDGLREGSSCLQYSDLSTLIEEGFERKVPFTVELAPMNAEREVVHDERSETTLSLLLIPYEGKWLLANKMIGVMVLPEGIDSAGLEELVAAVAHNITEKYKESEPVPEYQEHRPVGHLLVPRGDCRERVKTQAFEPDYEAMERALSQLDVRVAYKKDDAWWEDVNQSEGSQHQMGTMSGSLSYHQPRCLVEGIDAPGPDALSEKLAVPLALAAFSEGIPKDTAGQLYTGQPFSFKLRFRGNGRQIKDHDGSYKAFNFFMVPVEGRWTMFTAWGAFLLPRKVDDDTFVNEVLKVVSSVAAQQLRLHEYSHEGMQYTLEPQSVVVYPVLDVPSVDSGAMNTMSDDEGDEPEPLVLSSGASVSVPTPSTGITAVQSSETEVDATEVPASHVSQPTAPRPVSARTGIPVHRQLAAILESKGCRMLSGASDTGALQANYKDVMRNLESLEELSPDVRSWIQSVDTEHLESRPFVLWDDMSDRKPMEIRMAACSGGEVIGRTEYTACLVPQGPQGWLVVFPGVGTFTFNGPQRNLEAAFEKICQQLTPIHEGSPVQIYSMSVLCSKELSRSNASTRPGLSEVVPVMGVEVPEHSASAPVAAPEVRPEDAPAEELPEVDASTARAVSARADVLMESREDLSRREAVERAIVAHMDDLFDVSFFRLKETILSCEELREQGSFGCSPVQFEQSIKQEIEDLRLKAAEGDSDAARRLKELEKMMQLRSHIHSGLEVRRSAVGRNLDEVLEETVRKDPQTFRLTFKGQHANRRSPRQIINQVDLEVEFIPCKGSEQGWWYIMGPKIGVRKVMPGDAASLIKGVKLFFPEMANCCRAERGVVNPEVRKAWALESSTFSRFSPRIVIQARASQ